MNVGFKLQDFHQREYKKRYEIYCTIWRCLWNLLNVYMCVRVHMRVSACMCLHICAHIHFEHFSIHNELWILQHFTNSNTWELDFLCSLVPGKYVEQTSKLFTFVLLDARSLNSSYNIVMPVGWIDNFITTPSLHLFYGIEPCLHGHMNLWVDSLTKQSFHFGNQRDHLLIRKQRESWTSVKLYFHNDSFQTMLCQHLVIYQQEPIKQYA